MKNKLQKIALLYFGLLLAYWVILHISQKKTTNYNYAYSLLFSLIPLIGGLIAMMASRIWGTLRSSMGKTVFFFGLGLFCWGAGSMVWSYYNFVPKVAAPYPSLADFGFAPSIFFWGVGAVFLSKATGARFAFKNSVVAKIFTIVSVVVLPILAYYLLVHVARGGVVVPTGESKVKVILDIAYPLGDFFALILSVVISGLSFKYFGGYFKLPIISILTGLGVMFAADFVFSYTTTKGTFFNGDWGDLMLTIGLFLMTFGILGFSTKPALPATTTKEAA